MKELLNKAIKPPTKWISRKADTEYAYWLEDKTLYIAFQGSLSLTDWIYNFLAWSVIGTHYGIYKKWSYIKDEVLNIIDNTECDEVIVTGHSQGAGMALLSYYDIKKPVKAYLFGCPKIFSLWKALYLHNKSKNIYSYRVVNDIVTYLSPVNIAVGNQIFLGYKLPIWKWKVEYHYPKEYRRYL